MHFFLVPIAISAMQKKKFSRIHASEANAFFADAMGEDAQVLKKTREPKPRHVTDGNFKLYFKE